MNYGCEYVHSYKTSLAFGPRFYEKRSKKQETEMHFFCNGQKYRFCQELTF